MPKIKNQLDYKARFALGEAIKANGQMVGEYWAYNDGWSDERVAKELAVTDNNVRAARLALFGELKRGSPPGTNPIARLFDQMTAVEARLAEVERQLAASKKGKGTDQSSGIFPIAANGHR
jgi:hypothetical protein